MAKKTGIELIAEERRRQIEVEGWTSEHDANHDKGELIAAGGCYAAAALSIILEDARRTNQSPLAHFEVYDFGEVSHLLNDGDRGDRRIRKAGWKDGWPWDKKWDKRWKKNKIDFLAKAAALFAAEIDRLQSLKP